MYYAPKEKHLYVKNKNTNGKIYLDCYDTIRNKSNTRCRAKCIYTSANEHSRTTANHTDHENHEVTYRDLVSLNNMKDHCRYLAKNFPTSAHKVSVKEIFLLEMAKYVFFHILFSLLLVWVIYPDSTRILLRRICERRNYGGKILFTRRKSFKLLF